MQNTVKNLQQTLFGKYELNFVWNKWTIGLVYVRKLIGSRILCRNTKATPQDIRQKF